MGRNPSSYNVKNEAGDIAFTMMFLSDVEDFSPPPFFAKNKNDLLMGVVSLDNYGEEGLGTQVAWDQIEKLPSFLSSTKQWADVVASKHPRKTLEELFSKQESCKSMRALTTEGFVARVERHIGFVRDLLDYEDRKLAIFRSRPQPSSTKAISPEGPS